MGRTHTTPIQSDKKEEADKSTAPRSFFLPKKAASSAAETDEFLSEEELQQQLDKDRQERPPFFTWTDGQGQLRSQPIPQVDVDVQEFDNTELTDHTLLRSLRMANTDSVDCCSQYQAYFKSRLVEGKSIVFNRPQLNQNFPTQRGMAAAWYVQVPKNTKIDANNLPTLSIKVRHTEHPLALIALDEHYQPLHFIAKLKSQYFPENWRRVAYTESLISQADAAVAAFIVYFPVSVPDATTVELKWLP